MFSRCSVVVPHVDVFVGRKVISTSYSSTILQVSPTYLLFLSFFLITPYALSLCDRFFMNGSFRPAAGYSLYFFIIEPPPTRCSHISLLSWKVTLDDVDTRKPGVLMFRVRM